VKGPRNSKIRQWDACFCSDLAQGSQCFKQQVFVASLAMARLGPVAVEVSAACAVHGHVIGRGKLACEETLRVHANEMIGLHRLLSHNGSDIGAVPR